MKRIAAFVFLIVSALALAACGTTSSAYEKGLEANVTQYKLFSDTQLAQQQTLQECYRHNPNKSECSILTAGTNAQQTLAGQPKPLRVAKSTGEIIETIAEKGFETAKVIYGIDAVQKAITANARALSEASSAASAAQAETARMGFEAAGRPTPIYATPGTLVPLGAE